MFGLSRSRQVLSTTILTSLVAAPFAVMAPAQASPAGDQVVISEVYGAGGNAGAVLNQDYVELFNPTDEVIDLAGMSVQYRSATGTANPTGVIPLTGSIDPGGHYLVGGATGANGAAIPGPNDELTSVNLSGTTGTVFLANQTGALTAPPIGTVVDNPAIADLVGFGTSNTFEGVVAPAPSTTLSISRSAAGADTDDNAANFTTGSPSPEAFVEPPPPPGAPATIEEIQGTGDTSPLAGERVVATGVVTASYPTGGFNGFYLQTPGTGGALPDGHNGSNAVFVHVGASGTFPAIGAHVEVEGAVEEFFGLTEVTADADGVTVLPDSADPVSPTTVAFPTTDAAREDLEGMLLGIQGRYTVSDNFNLNNVAEIGLAAGTKVLRQPTDVGRPGSAAAAAAQAQIEARQVKLDDGATTNYLDAANKATPLPWLTTADPIRVGAEATITRPVVFDFRNSSWKLQPTQKLSAANAGTVQPATFENTRTAAPEPISGDIKLASFNVLNYFTALGAAQDVDNDGILDCTWFDDRAGNPITTNSTRSTGTPAVSEPSCNARGAWNAENLARQQIKIVKAINALDADVLSLEEIENSLKFGPDRDAALATLTAALNADAGDERWAYVKSPIALPTLADEDVIRNAFIYQKDVVEPVGPSRVLIGSTAFANAREPLAQVFKPVGGTPNQAFLAVVNHFKSKSPANPPLAADHPSGNGDKGDGAGAYNGDRVRQAQALVTFIDEVKAATATEKVFLTGDLNSYTHEDPMQVLYDAGYVDLGSTLANEQTYLFGGLMGSLDHLLVNASAASSVTDADVWNINSVESIALEYSRHNYNATNFYEETPYRSSDHDPLVIGFDVPAPDNSKTYVNVIDINDFHGRIEKTGTQSPTVKFAATVEQLRNLYGDASTIFVGAGDHIGGSQFASALADDQPTIDVLNALGLDASAVGNHEFDQGWADLRDDVIGPQGEDNAQWTYLGANVYNEGTEVPVLPEYDVFAVSGHAVCVVGAVTDETPTLVSPAGVAELDFGDPVAAVNRVVEVIKDECDVILATYHEGASEGTPDGATLEEEIADSPTFASIVNETSPEVDAIFTGHTHKRYAWLAPVPGTNKKRAVMQTGNYGEFVGNVVLGIDAQGNVTTEAYGNMPRATAPDASLIGEPRVAQVKQIVDAAAAEADVVGRVPVGEIAADITTAFSGGSYDPVKGYTGGTRDARNSESSLGNLVANSLRDTLADPLRGGAEIGVVNPGGLRAELFHQGTAPNPETNTDGVVTFAEANAVLPFVNNLWSLSLTGAELKEVLEQQWQTDAAGATVTSRPFQHLGLSDNVSVTLDASKPAGQRVTSVTIDGEPLDLAREYRVATFSFLATGGDNFRAFLKGGDVRDSGLVDRDAWMAYLTDHSDAAPIAPSFERRQVCGTGLPASISGGDQVSFTLGCSTGDSANVVRTLNLTSQGSPLNATVEVSLVEGGVSTPVGTFPVTNGVATVDFTAPAVTDGGYFVLTAQPSGTTVTIPADVAEVPPATTTVAATVAPEQVFVNETETTVGVTISSETPVTGGTIEVRDGATVLGTAPVAAGQAEVALPAFTSAGTHTLALAYLGDATHLASETTVVVDVQEQATTTVAATVSPAAIQVYKTKPTVDVTVASSTPVTGGTVELREFGTLLGSATVAAGKASVVLPVFTKVGSHTLTVIYQGDEAHDDSSATVRVTVRKAVPKQVVQVRPDAIRAVRTKPRLKVTLSTTGYQPRGFVVVKRSGKVLGFAPVVAGKTTVTLPAFATAGRKTVTVQYLGDDLTAGVSRKVNMRVVR